MPLREMHPVPEFTEKIITSLVGRRNADIVEQMPSINGLLAELIGNLCVKKACDDSIFAK